MMTEKEARGKECPMTFAGTYDFPCKGSDCMAWRWEKGAVWSESAGKHVVNVGSKMVRTSGSSYEAKSALPRQANGYCGLAGRPE